MPDLAPDGIEVQLEYAACHAEQHGYDGTASICRRARAEVERLKAAGAPWQERDEQFDDVRALKRLVEDARRVA